VLPFRAAPTTKTSLYHSPGEASSSLLYPGCLWPAMDGSAFSRKRPRNAPQPVQPPTSAPRPKTADGRSSPQKQSTRGRPSTANDPLTSIPSSGKIKKARDSSELARAKRGGAGVASDEMTAAEDDRESQHFTMGGVGARGTLYLTPSRPIPARFSNMPSTPPRTASRPGSAKTLWPASHPSDSPMRGHGYVRAKGSAYDHTIPVPPISLATFNPARRPRSHSFSTLSERERARADTLDSMEVQEFRFFLNGKSKRRSQSQRPQSSMNLGEGILQHYIPHYRLGTPRFSDRGTAYLHNSVYTTTTADDANSSTFSPNGELDKLFPVPPVRTHSDYQTTPSRTPQGNQTSSLPHSTVRTFIFDKIQANPNDPATVRFSAETGKITAATPARLIAQITSPDFLDYELLSHFFLTFRGFLSCADLLEYLLARMRWALGDAADSGRIARVRTFVALRHWILNYFQDDFLYNFGLRQRFCDLVNQMCKELSQRPDKGGGDLNILGELKKCWTRTCALFWQVPDTPDPAESSEIQPGGYPEEEEEQVRASLLGSPFTSKQPNVGDSQQAALAPQVASETGMHNPFQRHSSTGVAESMRSPIASMQSPGSPMSELSLQVVSCSVPFWSAMRPSANPLKKVLAPRPVGSRLHPPVSLGQGRPSHQHKRSGSFSDALRDERTPLPSAKIDSTELRELPNITLTAGLVRGFVLQPSTTQVQVHVPDTSPSSQQAETQTQMRPQTQGTGRTINIQEPTNVRGSQHQHGGVKRIVGDMRRVLSTRKPNRSPARSHKSTSSAGSKGSDPPKEIPKQEKPEPVITKQPPKGPPRHDILAEAAAKAYHGTNENGNAPRQSRSTSRPPHSAHDSVKLDDLLKRPYHERMVSQVTTSSQSIMIVDATGPQEEIPIISESLPSVSTWSTTMTPAPLLSRSPGQELVDRQDYFGDIHIAKSDDKAGASHDEYRKSSRPSLHALLSLPEDWRTTRAVTSYEYRPDENPAPARRSSGYEMQPIRNPIRRVPGGDLKNAGHVHDLESETRGQSYATVSTMSASLPTSYDLAGPRFSGQGLPVQITSLPARTAPQESLGLLDTPSQPYIRKSIKEDAWRLAKMADGSPGGGVEDALLKLEGRYAGRRASTQGIFTISARESGTPSRQSSKPPSLAPPQPIHGDIIMGDMDLLTPGTERQGASIFRSSGSDAFTLSRADTLPDDAGGMYDMDDVDDGSTAPVLQDTYHTTKYPIPSLPSGRPSYDEPQQATTVEPAQATRHATSKLLCPDRTGATTQMSFLLEDNESLSEISTELTDSPNGDGLGVRSFFFDDTIEEETSSPHGFRPPPTPPSTAGAQVERREEKTASHPSAERGEEFKGTASAPEMLTKGVGMQDFQQSQQDLAPAKTASDPDQPAHLPFIFEYSSSVIAEQLIIIEKDALAEIDWKDLIGLNWHQNPPRVRNWANYLRSSESENGIDLVIARFNVVVKWVVSEIVLTKSRTERARAITKFIHIASHSLRLKNYASTYQITLALLSTDITRLKRTWYLVPTSEKTNLGRLERLCQPVRNFAALRAEMEAASLAQGCIPFIGLYTHDLMYNAQKPGRINAAPSGAATAARLGPQGHESLINFERYQTSAVIAKGLLRLLEASARYELKPDTECLSRCLWLAALGDEEIADRSRALE